MRTCVATGSACGVCRAALTRIRKGFLALLRDQYSDRDLVDLSVLTSRIMLDVDQVYVLDEMDADVIDAAAAAGRYYADLAAEHVRLLYGEGTISA